MMSATSHATVCRHLALGLWLACASCTVAPEPQNNELERITDTLAGYYSNQAQIEAGELAPETDLLYPVFQRIDLPAFGSHAIYLQWPIGAPDGKLQRQRIWVFEEAADGIIMRFYTLKEPGRWVDAHLAPAKVQTMTPDDAIGYPDSCLLPVSVTPEQITASIPATCKIVSQRTQTEMTLEADIIITSTTVTYREGGVRPDGTDVFRVPAAGQYVFERLTD